MNKRPRRRRRAGTRAVKKTRHRRPSPTGGLTHFNAAGEAHMVHVGAKPVTARRAVAEGTIRMRPATLALILKGGHTKGDVLGVARIAGIMAAKRTHELVPLCHPLALDAIDIGFTPLPDKAAVRCRATVGTSARTGVEMEALTAVEVALLTIYDMCKSIDRGMVLTDIRLVAKSGGRSGSWVRDE